MESSFYDQKITLVITIVWTFVIIPLVIKSIWFLRVCTSWTRRKMSDSKATGYEATTENNDKNIYDNLLTIGNEPTSVVDKQDKKRL